MEQAQLRLLRGLDQRGEGHATVFANFASTLRR